MARIDAARRMVQAGGRLVTCGNAARYVHPHSEVPKAISLKSAMQLVSEMGLEEFACGARWPYSSWWRLPPPVG